MRSPGTRASRVIIDSAIDLLLGRRSAFWNRQRVISSFDGQEIHRRAHAANRRADFIRAPESIPLALHDEHRRANAGKMSVAKALASSGRVQRIAEADETGDPRRQRVVRGGEV